MKHHKITKQPIDLLSLAQYLSIATVSTILDLPTLLLA